MECATARYVPVGSKVQPKPSPVGKVAGLASLVGSKSIFTTTGEPFVMSSPNSTATVSCPVIINSPNNSNPLRAVAAEKLTLRRIKDDTPRIRRLGHGGADHLHFQLSVCFRSNYI